MSKAITLDNIPVIKELVQDEIEGNTPSAMVSITYADLVAKANDGELVPGQQYRITDYVTTTAQANTQSAGHAFDIIVTADSTDTLNENARAVKHEGDTYFKNCNLAAWKIKYNINNDTKYEWADTTNGKGVIYEMEDEHGNRCGYDFKNIMFARYKITATTSPATFLVGKYAGMKRYETDAFAISEHTVDETACKYYYTFTVSMGMQDLSVSQGVSQKCSNNKIALLFGNTRYVAMQLKQFYLPNIVIAVSTISSTIIDNTFDTLNYEMTFLGANVRHNTFEKLCGDNVFCGETLTNIFRSTERCNFGGGCKYNDIYGGYITCSGSFIHNISNSVGTYSSAKNSTFSTIAYSSPLTEANNAAINNKIIRTTAMNKTISTADDGTITFGGDIINFSPVDKPVTVAYTLSADGETDITGTLSVTAAADSTTTFSGTETGVAGKTYRVAYVISYTLGENTIQIKI